MIPDGEARDPAPMAPDAAGQAEVMATLTRAVEAVGRVLSPDTEVVLHDLSKIPNSLVAISGTVTGRKVGDPITDFLLRKLTDPHSPDHQSYRTTLPDGRELISHTTLFRDASGRAIAALCSNVDTTRWRAVEEAVGFFTGAAEAPPAVVEVAESEGFPHDLDELRTTILDDAIRRVAVPVDLMQKRHKLQVVADLRDSGFFTLRDAVPSAAQALEVSRFTVYNYLKQLDPQGDD